ncbi:GTP-binding protein 10 homolog [Lycorma delicatula]|uniref:GTP-binding protein 10 homolog n=1 Tax=Lycorma delicatula TaxID=130591 RepID=UPI003F511412
MVILTTILRNIKVDNPIEYMKKHLKGKLIDTVRLTVKGGHGGNGYPKYGGVGGAGGNVYIKAVEGLTLKDVLKKFKDRKVTAANGKDSHKRCILGMRGEDKMIEAPVGITVYNQRKLSLGELNEEGRQILIARGGAGGCPESGYGGMKGEVQVITIDLKLIADVGFVGFPNAGKSTLLSALSRAKPKIASYPFTTIRPNIGIMMFKDGRQISLADLPGLIEGAHCNIGMGHRFLRHVERTKLLLLVVDIQGFQLSPKHTSRNFLETIVLLNKELELYRQDLLEKPAILIVNKMDTENSDKIFKESEEYLHNLADYVQKCPEEMRPEQLLHFESVIPFSARFFNNDDLIELKTTIRDVIDNAYGVYDVEKEIDLVKSLENKIKGHSDFLI